MPHIMTFMGGIVKSIWGLTIFDIYILLAKYFTLFGICFEVYIMRTSCIHHGYVMRTSRVCHTYIMLTSFILVIFMCPFYLVHFTFSYCKRLSTLFKSNSYYSSVSRQYNLLSSLRNCWWKFDKTKEKIKLLQLNYKVMFIWKLIQTAEK